MKQPQSKPQPLLITTEHRGVFFGYGQPTSEATIRLERARMCIFWSTEMHGVLGLATKGPDKSSRVGPAVSAIIINAVTSITEVSDEAAKAWEAEPWN